MTSQQAEKRIAVLRRELNRHNRLYYVKARPEISDREYDALYDELKKLEEQFPTLVTPDSPTQRVGGAPLKEFKSVRHRLPMQSLDKAETLHELENFEKRIHDELPGEEIRYVIEPKVDGVSIGVLFEDGLFTRGVTRGDGTTGDDITANLRTIRDIPLRLMTQGRPPPLLEIRGEVYMRDDDRVELNEEMEKEGDKPFPNSRNAAAGSLKLLDPKVVAKRRLRAVFYAVGATDGIEFTSHNEELETIRSLGLPIPSLRWACRRVDEAVAYAKEMKERESELPYEIDGLVIKIDNVDQCRRLGIKAKAPAFAIAYKPREWRQLAETRLREVQVQVGRTGVLTPVAKLDPIFLEGTTISSATLHNWEELKRKDIRVGDTVVIERAGKVIPAVVKAVIEKRTGKETAISAPSKCPTCGSPAVQKEIVTADRKEVALRCDNLQCPAQRTRRIEHFASRTALNIEGLGGVVADAVVARELVREPLDLMEIQTKFQQLVSLNLGTDDEPRVLGEKNATKIVEALKKSRDLPLSRWLFALGIPEVGEINAYKVSAIHKTIEEIAHSAILKDITDLYGKKAERERINPGSRLNPPKTDKEKAERQARADQLDKEIAKIEERLRSFDIKDVGPVVAESILSFFASPQGKEVLARFKKLELAPKGGATAGTASDQATASAVSGKTVVLTGELDSMSREKATELIRARGGSVTGSVSRKTSFVVAGHDPGANKMDDAKQFGITVINEQQFLDMLGPIPTSAPPPPSSPLQQDLFSQSPKAARRRKPK